MDPSHPAATRLALLVIEQGFGPVVHAAAAALVKRGPLTLRDLGREARLSPADARRAALALLQHNFATAHALGEGGLAAALALGSGGGGGGGGSGRGRGGGGGGGQRRPSTSGARPHHNPAPPSPTHLYVADEAGMLHALRHARAVDLVARMYAAHAELPPPRPPSPSEAAAPSLPPHAHVMAALAEHGRLTSGGVVAAAAARVAAARRDGGGEAAAPADAAAACAAALADLVVARLVERAPPACLPPARPAAVAGDGGGDPAVEGVLAAWARARWAAPEADAVALAAQARGSGGGQATPGAAAPASSRKRGRAGGSADGAAAPASRAAPPPLPITADSDEAALWAGAPAAWRPSRPGINRALRAEAAVAGVLDRRGPATAAVLAAVFAAAAADKNCPPPGPAAEGDTLANVCRPSAGGGPPYPAVDRADVEASLATHRAGLEAAAAAGLLPPPPAPPRRGAHAGAGGAEGGEGDASSGDSDDDPSCPPVPASLPPPGAKIDVDVELAALAEEGAVDLVRDGDDGGGGGGSGRGGGRGAATARACLRAGSLLASARAREVEAVVRTRFGPEGVRVVRLLRSARQLEQKAVGEAAMLPAKAARVLLFRLLRGGAVALQDVPRAADRAPSRSFYTWRVDDRGSASRLAAEALAAAGNAVARLVHEAEAARVGEAAAALAAAAAAADSRPGGGGGGGRAPHAGNALPLSEARAARLRAYSAHRRLLWARILALDGLVATMMDG